MTTTLLGASGAARILGVSASRVTQLNKYGALPAIRDSAGRRLYQRADVEALAQARAVAGHRPAIQESVKPSTGMSPQLREFIDRVIVPALAEAWQREADAGTLDADLWQRRWSAWIAGLNQRGLL